MTGEFVPKLWTTLKGYTRAQFLQDLGAGTVVGIVALPLAIAFAIASGVPPERGLITAIVAGFLISALGGSRVQIGGPTGAFVVIVYGIVHRYGVDGLLIATLMAGVILVAFGFARLGSAIRFIPHAVVTGFTSGIAVIIFSSQIKDLLGLPIGDVPPDFVGKWQLFAAHLVSFDPTTALVALGSLLVLIAWPRIQRTIPGPFVVLVVGTVVVAALGLPVETIGTRFGSIPDRLPAPHIPGLPFATWMQLVGPAFTIALLASVESLLSAVVADGMLGTRHRSNMELVAQGAANLVAPLFGGIPATGAIARTATNVKNGGRTPIAGIVHAGVVLLAVVLFGHLAAKIPLAVLAAILTVVAYHMGDWRTFVAELRAPKSDVAVLLATFLLTILVDLTVAIEVGVVLATFLFMRRMSEVTQVNMFSDAMIEGEDESESDPDGVRRREIPRGVEVYEIDGPFFFGAAETFKSTLARVAARPKVLIVRLRHVPAIDSTGLHALEDLRRRCERDKTLLLLSDVHAQPLVAMERAGFLAALGSGGLAGTLDEALALARTHLASES
ncbi:MAG: sulfate permease [Candidatus Eisenbacteria bacterium]